MLIVSVVLLSVLVFFSLINTIFNYIYLNISDQISKDISEIKDKYTKFLRKNKII